MNIADKLKDHAFEKFALNICNQRLARLPQNGGAGIDIETMLTSMSEDAEAERLGVGDIVSEKLSHFPSAPNRDLNVTPLEMYFALFWAEANQLLLDEVLRERESDPKRWRTRYENYKHALLFTIRRRRSGIRKYYCGWRSFVQLSGANIRYLLELVDQTLLSHLQRGEQFGDPISPDTQSRAAESVGKKNVSELEGLSVQGAQLTKLVLGLGRVFEVMAQQLEGHAPEVNQFAITQESDRKVEFEGLVHSAVMHLALLRTTATKRADETDVKAYDYSLHPIFAPFFVYSHRKKRKMRLGGRASMYCFQPLN